MGNPLSPLISEVFMAKFEMDLKSAGKLSRILHRYVDDIFAVVKKDEVNNILDMLNSQYDEFNFTCEIEENNKLVFLDLELQRNRNKVEIAIYHKPTSTLGYTPSDSYAPIQHKLAAFHSSAHRLVNLPLTLNNYIAEFKHGYSATSIENIIKKHAKKKVNADLSTLFTQNKQIDKQTDLKRVSITFAPEITNGLKSVFHRNNMQLVFSNPFKLKNQLKTIKDKTDKLDKPGIYRLTCSDCDSNYYGQSKRSVRKRFGEHEKYIRNNEPRKSAFAANALEHQHLQISEENISVLKCVNNEQKLDAYESMYIHRDSTALNLDKGNIESDLFNIF